MAIKKIEDMDYYEILNVKRSASQQEIEKAYLLGKTTYRRDSLAHYSLLSEEERDLMLKKIEEAYKNLKGPKKRRKYDLEMLKSEHNPEDKVYFRKSIQKLEIEDAEGRNVIWTMLKSLFSPKKRKKN